MRQKPRFKKTGPSTQRQDGKSRHSSQRRCARSRRACSRHRRRSKVAIPSSTISTGTRTSAFPTGAPPSRKPRPCRRFSSPPSRSMPGSRSRAAAYSLARASVDPGAAARARQDQSPSRLPRHRAPRRAARAPAGLPFYRTGSSPSSTRSRRPPRPGSRHYWAAAAHPVGAQARRAPRRVPAACPRRLCDGSPGSVLAG